LGQRGSAISLGVRRIARKKFELVDGEPRAMAPASVVAEARARMSSLYDNPLDAHAALFLESLDFFLPAGGDLRKYASRRACGN
jgi:hypothetical protein